MFNLLDKIKADPGTYRQLAVTEQLVTEFTCPLDAQKQGMWAEQDYVAYVLEGKKAWHVNGERFELSEGKCLYVRKGAHIVEQFFGSRFCVFFFFLDERFIASTLQSAGIQGEGSQRPEECSICFVDVDEQLAAFFHSVQPLFAQSKPVSRTLLELKFRELILTLIGNDNNRCVKDYFASLIRDDAAQKLERIMEENFLYNLPMSDFARLCGKSLSVFKRDFRQQFHTTPGRWLLTRRLEHARKMVQGSDKYISEIAYECGFESAAHFSKAFKSMYGKSPVDFRPVRS